MSRPNDQRHISSAVVTVQPGHREHAVGLIERMEGIDVHVQDDHHIVITLEGGSPRELGDQLTQINLIDGVLAANMVFEYVDKQEVS